jgi:hypothetical protein
MYTDPEILHAQGASGRAVPELWRSRLCCTFLSWLSG